MRALIFWGAQWRTEIIMDTLFVLEWPKSMTIHGYFVNQERRVGDMLDGFH